MRVIPRARKTELGGTRGTALLIRLAAPPLDNLANGALLAFIAERCNVPRRSVRLVSGERSRTKRVAIDGLTVEAAQAALR